MPPVMDRKKTVARPVGFTAGVPVDTVIEPMGHLHHMGHRMNRPGIARCARHGATTIDLGLLVVSHLFETEGMHAEVIAVQCTAFIDIGQAPGDAVAQFTRLTHEEIGLMRRKHRKAIIRTGHQDFLPPGSRLVKTPGGPGIERRDMRKLAIVGPA